MPRDALLQWEKALHLYEARGLGCNERDRGPKTVLGTGILVQIHTPRGTTSELRSDGWHRFRRAFNLAEQRDRRQAICSAVAAREEVFRASLEGFAIGYREAEGIG